MHRLALGAPALLAASCAANSPPPDSPGPPQPTPIHGVTPGHKCQTVGTDRFVGQPGTSETGAAIKHASNAAILRWSPPGVMLTMDYREDRVTVWLDSSKIVTKIRCG
ncbi:MAG TPA: I78 family peptidase inhibitor [Bradyrhizobium sp.]|nr:I78 family peptidase inhibitor [Bradyrhizobium sp.]